MCKVRVTILGEGPGPQEKIVRIKKADGTSEELVTHSNTLKGETVETALIFRDQDGLRALVELPRESASGSWRLWVSQDQLVG